MNRDATTWTIRELQGMFAEIEFPEYQREPNIWKRDAKQRLVDSILRQFDIATVYFYRRDDGVLECIDGRQRLNAIMAFLGENESDSTDNGFPLRIRNEIFEEENNELSSLDGYTYEGIGDLAQNGNEGVREIAAKAVKRFTEYEVTVILLSDATRPEEFNLQFLRLNLGVLVNAGEKLKAMVGNMRDLLFAPGGIGQHGLLRLVEIPTRRYAREVVAAQILCQAFSLRERGEFTKARHYDLQRFVKNYADVDPDEEVVVEIRQTLDELEKGLENEAGLLRNRAMTVSVVLLAWQDGLFKSPPRVGEFAEFLRAFMCRLQWQVRNMKSFTVDDQYRYLIDFQRDVTQAAVERPAVERRHVVLEEELRRWRTSKTIRGDEEFRSVTGKDPEEACREGE